MQDSALDQWHDEMAQISWSWVPWDFGQSLLAHFLATANLGSLDFWAGNLGNCFWNSACVCQKFIWNMVLWNIQLLRKCHFSAKIPDWISGKAVLGQSWGALVMGWGCCGQQLHGLTGSRRHKPLSSSRQVSKLNELLRGFMCIFVKWK